MAVPTFDELFNPLLKTMHLLGGSGSVEEIDGKVAEIINLSEQDVNEIHRGSQTKLKYRLAWSRNYLKRYGLLENSSRGIWALTPKGLSVKEVDKEEVKRQVRLHAEAVETIEEETEEGREPNEEVVVWQEKLLEKLKNISPAAFERLCQRMLREAGFIQVEVTGKSGDGGIDGKGIVKIGGFLNFYVIFQCKRYSGNVPVEQIRDFRGTMAGRADKGLFITTGNFTTESKKEAVRDGVPPIDLVDGNQLVEKMKELGLGIKIKTEEAVEVDEEWINGL
jgi:restriction system protein